MKVKAEKHPTENYARILFTAESEAELHELDLIHQGLITTAAKEAKFENSKNLALFFVTGPEFPKA